MIRSQLYLVSTMVAGAVGAAIGHAEQAQWNRFRGPNGTGMLQSARPPEMLEPQNLQWRAELPEGHSSPIIWNDRIFVTGLEADRLVTLCIDAVNGDIKWRKAAPEVALEELHEANHPASPTPAADRDQVYVYFGSFGVICYDHAGNEVWQRQLPPKGRGYGTSISPIVHEDTVILVLDDQEHTSHILGLDRSDGTTKWDIPRPLFRNNGYSTPVIWNHDDQVELVVMGFGQLNAYDARSGQELWWIGGLSRQPIPGPIVGDDRLYVAAADRGGEGGNPSDPEKEWEGLTYFDTNKDGKIEKGEMTAGFGFPLRPELPPTHPGWGFPIEYVGGPDAFLARLDLDKDGGVSEEEYHKVSEARGSRSGGLHALMSIRPGAKGDAKETHVEWVVQRDIAEIPTPVLVGKRLYSVRDGGVITCFDCADGGILFRNRIPAASGQYCASLVAADGKIFAASANGVVSVLEAGPEFSLLSQRDFREEIYATPALQGDRLFLRTNRALYAFGNAP